MDCVDDSAETEHINFTKSENKLGLMMVTHFETSKNLEIQALTINNEHRVSFQFLKYNILLIQC